MGEVYFYGLAEYFNRTEECDKLALLAQVECFAAKAVRPLIKRHGLTPRPDKELKSGAEEWIENRDYKTWQDFVTDMSIRYPAYVDQFRALEKIAPEDDLPALKILTDREVILVEFANREIKQRPDSLEPVHDYLAQSLT